MLGEKVADIPHGTYVVNYRDIVKLHNGLEIVWGYLRRELVGAVPRVVDWDAAEVKEFIDRTIRMNAEESKCGDV